MSEKKHHGVHYCKCNLGDPVYVMYMGEAVQGTVQAIHIRKAGKIIDVALHLNVNYHPIGAYYMDQVFFTEKDAIAADVERLQEEHKYDKHHSSSAVDSTSDISDTVNTDSDRSNESNENNESYLRPSRRLCRRYGES